LRIAVIIVLERIVEATGVSAPSVLMVPPPRES
jgi:hypothetical protein